MIQQADLLFAFLPEPKGKSSKKAEARENEKREEIKTSFKDKISVLSVSYHNLGVE